MKKIFLIIFLAFLFLSFSQVQADGLVPCGPGTNKPVCELCDLFVLLDSIIDFILRNIIIPLAVLLLVIGGGLFIFSAGNPARLDQAKSILTSVVIGLIVIFAAWLILGLFFHAIGLANWTTNIYQNWWEKGFFEISCQ